LIVIDASVSIAWSFENQRTPALVALLTQVATAGAVAPQLWPIEVANVVLRAGKRGQIPAKQGQAILSNLAALGIEIDGETADRVWHATLDLAAKHGLTVYDATYLELAARRQLPLATLDEELARAARAEGVPVLP
jgi:predicted nucleic acid-binding protein